MEMHEAESRNMHEDFKVFLKLTLIPQNTKETI